MSGIQWNIILVFKEVKNYNSKYSKQISRNWHADCKYGRNSGQRH